MLTLSCIAARRREKFKTKIIFRLGFLFRYKTFFFLQRIRQSWNKHNLYNLSQLPRFSTAETLHSLFQQKWKAKSVTRAYHGEQVSEKQWERIFQPRMASVVPMDHVSLARWDGSRQAAGRGSGEERPTARRSLEATPYMPMLYAPLERRLDTAVFRAMFASSTRQARQFVVHGYVRVNGKKVSCPSLPIGRGPLETTLLGGQKFSRSL
jgi:ribosomal protein S4